MRGDYIHENVAVKDLFDSGYASESFSSFDEFAEDEISEIGIFLTKIDKEKKLY